MGNRVLVQLVSEGANGPARVSPVLYGHWSGDEAANWLHQLTVKMGDRINDISYSFARLVQIALADDKEITGYGVWNQAEKLKPADSHGDSGIYVLNVDTKKIEHFG
jgi:hypothetical protein